MIVCVCHRVSDRDIERAVDNGCSSFDSLQRQTRVSTGCGRCRSCACETFERAVENREAREALALGELALA
jgi:bacterioferritin-associated ferredoxin